MSIKETKKFIRDEVEGAGQTIFDQLVQIRESAKLFKKVTKPDTTAHGDQITHLSSGMLGTMAVEFDQLITAIGLFYEECKTKAFFTVSDEQKRDIKTVHRRYKHLLRSVMELSQTERDFEIVLASFWAPSVPSDPKTKVPATKIDCMFVEAKMLETAVRNLKKVIMKHINSGAFTTVIRTERLAERFRIGDKDREGEIVDVNDNEDDEDDIVDNKVVYDDEKIDYKDENAVNDLAQREARQFIKAANARKKRSRSDDDDDDDDDKGDDEAEKAGDANGVDSDDNDAPLPKIKSAITRGGKALRRRPQRQLDTLRAQAAASKIDDGPVASDVVAALQADGSGSDDGAADVAANSLDSDDDGFQSHDGDFKSDGGGSESSDESDDGDDDSSAGDDDDDSAGGGDDDEDDGADDDDDDDDSDKPKKAKKRKAITAADEAPKKIAKTSSTNGTRPSVVAAKVSVKAESKSANSSSATPAQPVAKKQQSITATLVKKEPSVVEKTVKKSKSILRDDDDSAETGRNPQNNAAAAKTNGTAGDDDDATSYSEKAKDIVATAAVAVETVQQAEAADTDADFLAMFG